MNRKKGYNFQQYRGHKKRDLRKQQELSREEIDNKILELKRLGVMEFFVKDLDENNFSPTGQIYVEFNLRKNISLEYFKNILYARLCDVL